MPLAAFLGPFADVPQAFPQAAAGIAQAAGGRPKQLSFDMQSQERTEWCWAATAASVSRYYAATSGVAAKSQCEIATICVGFACCPPLPPDWDGNRFWALEDALDATAHLATGPTDSYLSFQDIVHEIDEGRPVCCRIYWDNGSGHFNVITGYANELAEEVVIRDPEPSYGNSVMPYRTFVTNYHGGKWKAAYLTK
jgi:hypothetical protein